jgi:ATP-dependent protease ClpP protease subunit
MNEIRFVQEKYSKALTRETNLTAKTMKDLLEKHVNIYLSAEEAVKYGIADEVF